MNDSTYHNKDEYVFEKRPLEIEEQMLLMSVV